MGQVKTIPPKLQVDLDVFGAKEIRDVLKSRAHCLRAGFPVHHFIITTFNEIRDHYIQKIGLPTYLSQMLGPLGNTPIHHCVLFDQADSPIQVSLADDPNRQPPLQRFIAKNFPWNELPFRVEVRQPSDPDRVEVRYL